MNVSGGAQGICEDTYGLYERFGKSGDLTSFSANSPPGSAAR